MERKPSYGSQLELNLILDLFNILILYCVFYEMEKCICFAKYFNSNIVNECAFWTRTNSANFLLGTP